MIYFNYQMIYNIYGIQNNDNHFIFPLSLLCFPIDINTQCSRSQRNNFRR